MVPARPGASWWVLFVVMSVAMLFVAGDHALVGGYVLAAGLLTAAGARTVLPEALTPGLKVRSRLFDVALYTLLAGAVLLLFTQIRWGSG